MDLMTDPVGIRFLGSSEGIQIEYAAVFLAVLFPGALVAFNHELLEMIPRVATLRIYCAGIWHNAAVLDVSAESPLYNYLSPGKPIRTSKEWMETAYLLDKQLSQTKDNYISNKGYCVPNLVIASEDAEKAKIVVQGKDVIALANRSFELRRILDPNKSCNNQGSGVQVPNLPKCVFDKCAVKQNNRDNVENATQKKAELKDDIFINALSYTKVLSESENSEGGHWKSRPKKKKSSGEEDDLSQPWVCEEIDPFTPRIRYFYFQKTRMPSHIKTYDGSEDPEDHLKIFQAAAKTERWAMPTWCHMFNSTMTVNARVWFDDLPAESIDRYDDLKKAFLENYLQQNKCIKDPIEIHNIKQREGESTEDFVKRYKLESRDVKGAP
ncbi:reverse transcriptase domain-containing protein [Tanacetum coccineum]